MADCNVNVRTPNNGELSGVSCGRPFRRQSRHSHWRCDHGEHMRKQVKAGSANGRRTRVDKLQCERPHTKQRRAKESWLSGASCGHPFGRRFRDSHWRCDHGEHMRKQVKAVSANGRRTRVDKFEDDNFYSASNRPGTPPHHFKFKRTRSNRFHRFGDVVLEKGRQPQQPQHVHCNFSSIFVYTATTCITRLAYEIQPHQVKLYSCSCKHQTRKDTPLFTLHTINRPTTHTLARSQGAGSQPLTTSPRTTMEHLKHVPAVQTFTKELSQTISSSFDLLPFRIVFMSYVWHLTIVNYTKHFWLEISFSCSTLLVPSFHTTTNKHEGWDTARSPRPKQGKLRGRVRTTDLTSTQPILCEKFLRSDLEPLMNFPTLSTLVHDKETAIRFAKPRSDPSATFMQQWPPNDTFNCQQCRQEISLRKESWLERSRMEFRTVILNHRISLARLPDTE
ncbi:hypothetical protein T265_11316 [Opisthorchis viverrini]|uniref:Uncharacterized protein n=1 Tax=Opisthorchis viverrini TaxID=6198 RepID=A0A074Z3F8_OPIVI|nr:hypothetical protein T265_11316 [Opisthorchis viverrini]KER20052.1 hypothetical protein T265_11316 [Opisthorchis viverrini]